MILMNPEEVLEEVLEEKTNRKEKYMGDFEKFSRGWRERSFADV
jgi:hypothetical protein